jgi:hypothetical protein
LYRVSQNKQFIAGVDTALELLHWVDMGAVSDISEVHGGTTFSVQGSGMNNGSVGP